MESVENEDVPVEERDGQIAPLNEEEAEHETAAENEEVFTERMMVTGGADLRESADAELKAVIEAVIYITDEPLAAQQIAAALVQPLETVNRVLVQLAEEYQREDRGLTIREVAGGYKMATKPEHHEHTWRLWRRWR
jgi:hypothetical protein